MLERLPRLQRNLVLALIGALVLWFAWTIRAVINPLVLGYLLAFILHPLVVRVQGFGFSRRTAVNWIFVLGFLLLGGTVFGLVAQTRKLVRDVIDDPEVRSKLADRFSAVGQTVEDWLGPEWNPEWNVEWLLAQASDFIREHSAEVQGAAKASWGAASETFGFVGGVLGAVFAVLGLLFLVPLYTYFLLFELDNIHTFVTRHLPIRDRDRLAHVGRRVGEVIANFFRGRLSVCLMKGAFLSAGLALTGVPYAFLFGMTSGFLSLIPFFGPFVGFSMAALVAMLDHGVLGALLRTGIVFGLAELLEGYVLIPKVLGDSLGLHPVVVLFAILAGGAAFGMLGVLIALPVTASLVILAQEFVLPALQKSVDE